MSPRGKEWHDAIRAITSVLGPHVCGIYRFTSKTTGRFYIGQAHNVAERIRQHARCAVSGSKGAWYRALAEEGVGGFVFDMIEYLPKNREVLNERENLWLSFHGAGEDLRCLNTYHKAGLTPLGTSVPPVVAKRRNERLKGRAISEDVKARISATKLTPEGRARNSAANKGRKRTPEAVANMQAARERPDVKAKMSLALRGRKLSANHVAKITARVRSPEWRAKISAINRGRKISQETREKIRAAMLGVKHTDERRNNQSLARKKILAQNKSPWAGRKHTQESRQKMKQSRLKFLQRQKQQSSAIAA